MRENDRPQIRFLRQTSRIATLKFSDNVGKVNPAKFLGRFEELAEMEGVVEREKLADFIAAMQGDALLWINCLTSTDWDNIDRNFLINFGMLKYRESSLATFSMVGLITKTKQVSRRTLEN